MRLIFISSSQKGVVGFKTTDLTTWDDIWILFDCFQEFVELRLFELLLVKVEICFRKPEIVCFLEFFDELILPLHYLVLEFALAISDAAAFTLLILFLLFFLRIHRGFRVLWLWMLWVPGRFFIWATVVGYNLFLLLLLLKIGFLSLSWFLS